MDTNPNSIPKMYLHTILPLICRSVCFIILCYIVYCIKSIATLIHLQQRDCLEFLNQNSSYIRIECIEHFTLEMDFGDFSAWLLHMLIIWWISYDIIFIARFGAIATFLCVTSPSSVKSNYANSFSIPYLLMATYAKQAIKHIKFLKVTIICFGAFTLPLLVWYHWLILFCRYFCMS